LKKFKLSTYRKNIIKLGFIACFIFLFPYEIFADSIKYSAVKSLQLDPILKTNAGWRVTAYEAENIENKYELEIPAKLCFENSTKTTQQKCFYPEYILDKMTTYKCQFVKNLSIIALCKNQIHSKAVLFTAEFFGGGSGSLKLITLWSFNNKENNFINLLPPVAITEQGEYQFFINLKDNIGCLFIKADYIFGDDETHFSPHRYRIKIYRYSKKTNSFKFVNKYETKVKYKSLNDVDEISVIKYEKKKILDLILSKKRRGNGLD